MRADVLASKTMTNEYTYLNLANTYTSTMHDHVDRESQLIS